MDALRWARVQHNEHTVRLRVTAVRQGRGHKGLVWHKNSEAWGDFC